MMIAMTAETIFPHGTLFFFRLPGLSTNYDQSSMLPCFSRNMLRFVHGHASFEGTFSPLRRF